MNPKPFEILFLICVHLCLSVVNSPAQYQPQITASNAFTRVFRYTNIVTLTNITEAHIVAYEIDGQYHVLTNWITPPPKPLSKTLSQTPPLPAPLVSDKVSDKVLAAAAVPSVPSVAPPDGPPIRVNKRPDPDGTGVQMWMLASNNWTFQCSTNLIDWLTPGNETAYDNGWRMTETSQNAIQPQLFIRAKRP